MPLYLRTANSYDGKGSHRIFISYFQLLIQINKRYTQTEILERLNVIFEREDIPKLGGTYQAVQELHYFCTTTRPQNSYYVIQSHKPALDFEPLSEVSDVGMSLRKYFDY